MKYLFNAEGICTKQFIIEVEDGKMVSLDSPRPGCQGNFLGMAAITKGMDITDIIDRYEGIPCRGKLSSCPAELAKALRMIKNNELPPMTE